MTERDKPDQDRYTTKTGDRQGKPKDASVTVRPRSNDTKVWPRLLRLTLKDGTPIEDMMLR